MFFFNFHESHLLHKSMCYILQIIFEQKILFCFTSQSAHLLFTKKKFTRDKLNKNSISLQNLSVNIDDSQLTVNKISKHR